MTAIVRIREGSLPRPWGATAFPWRQCEVISDDRVVIIDMTPALFDGWRFGKVEVQGHEDWCGMSAEAILKYKEGDTCARLATDGERASVLAHLKEKEGDG